VDYPCRSEFSTGSSLYETHVPTTFVQKVMLAGEAAFGALRDPERADLVATLGDTTGGLSLSTMHEKMKRDEIGREILAERPVIAESTRIEELRAYPPGTFGKAYADWMEARAYRPEERPEVKYVDDPELAYVMQRYREVHDFVHVLTGLGSTEEEEIALTWFELLQTGLCVSPQRHRRPGAPLSSAAHPHGRRVGAVGGAVFGTGSVLPQHLLRALVRHRHPESPDGA